MSMLESVLLVIHLLVAVAVCGFVLLQHGKGADMGAVFGGASSTIFGPSSRRISLPTISFRPAAFAATWARTTPASEHSSVTARAA